MRGLTPALALLVSWGAQAHDWRSSAGDVALADWPYCNTIAIRTALGFIIAEWQDGLWLFDPGDPVVGALGQTGQQTIWIDNQLSSGEMTVRLHAVGLTWVVAQETFGDACAIRGWRHSAALTTQRSRKEIALGTATY